MILYTKINIERNRLMDLETTEEINFSDDDTKDVANQLYKDDVRGCLLSATFVCIILAAPLIQKVSTGSTEFTKDTIELIKDPGLFVTAASVILGSLFYYYKNKVKKFPKEYINMHADIGINKAWKKVLKRRSVISKK